MCAQQMSPVDDSLHLRESIIGGSLILNARSIQFEQKKSFSRTYYAVFFLFFFLQTRRENSIPSLRQWIEYVGSASERRMDSHTTAPTSCMAWARHDRRLASRYYDVLENTSSLAFSRSRFFFFSAATWKGAIVVKRLRRDGSLTIHTIYRVAPAVEATRRDFPSIINSPTRIEIYRLAKGPCLFIESFFS